jgi:fermentation-respiration switch protein FrsA (DUF1100 family)
VIPYAHAAKLLEKAGQPKTLLTVEGGGHIEAFTPRFGSKYQDAVVEFFNAALSGAAK